MNCHVKPARDGGMEVMATKWSKVGTSPRKLNVSKETMTESSKVVELCDVDGLSANQVICVSVKVVSVFEPVVVHSREGKELKKQDCIVADGSGCCHVVVWEDDVGALVEGDWWRVIATS